MATVREEAEHLKLVIGAQQGSRRMTVIDHAERRHHTGTAVEIFQLFKDWISKGRAEKIVHVVDHREERERKFANAKRSTRVVLNCRTPDQWKEFQKAKEPYFEIAKDPHIAIDLMTKALKAFSRKVIEGWVNQGHDHPADPPAPKAKKVPDWLK